MNFLKNWSIKQRLITVFILSMVFFIGFSVFTIIGMARMGELINRLHDHAFAVSNATLDANGNISRIQEKLNEIMILKDNYKIQQTIQEINELEKNVYGDLDSINNLILGDEGKRKAAETKEIFFGWKPLRDQYINLVMRGEKDQAIKFSADVGDPYLQRMEIKFQELAVYSRARADLNTREANVEEASFRMEMLFITVWLSIILFLFFLLTIKSIQAMIAQLKQAMAESMASGKLITVNLPGKNEIVDMSKDYNALIDVLRAQFWSKDGLNQLSEELFGDNSTHDLAQKSVVFLARYLAAGNGVFYIYDKEEGTLGLAGSYAFTERDVLSNKYVLGNGTIGQAALEKKPILLKNITRSDALITTGTISLAPLNTYTFPLIHEKEVYGVIELGSFEPFDQVKQQFLGDAGKIIAINLFTTVQRETIQELLSASQRNNTKLEEQQQMLQQQSEELQQTNSQLEEQQQVLQQQSEELQQTNSQLEEQQQTMQQQSEMLASRNANLLETQKNLDQRAKELETANEYKSQFLANMSHELRTPLNSIILLSKLLSQNTVGNLNNKDLEKALIIHSAGNELLRLINDILDLSKIEAGKMQLNVTTFDTKSFLRELTELFEPVAKDKGLEFVVQDDLNGSLAGDRNLISQIVRNFLANAFKFTKHGKVILKIAPSGDAEKPVVISVADTGMGIPPEKQKAIFSAFHQVDGSGKFGGTGLGLHISKEIAKLIHAEIRVHSVEGEGSEFSLLLDADQGRQEEANSLPLPLAPQAIASQQGVNTFFEDDRNSLSENDRVILLIEDDELLAGSIRAANSEKGIKTLLAGNGAEGMALAKRYRVDGILLDLGLPDMSGMEVLRELKSTLELRDIPVYIMSGWEDSNITQKMGAIGYLKKPVEYEKIAAAMENMFGMVERAPKNVLVVEDVESLRAGIKELIESRQVQVTAAGTEKEAIDLLIEKSYDVVILDLHLEKGNGFNICKYIKENRLGVPVIVFTGKDMTQLQESELRKYVDSIIIKTANSFERLSDEVAAFLRMVPRKVRTENYLYDKVQQQCQVSLENKKILIVDDDPKNIFVLTAALEDYGADIIEAENGKVALEKLAKQDVDLILMDIMMPVMDGFEAIKAIRNSEKMSGIPIIALTAKALKGDKEKCIAAGANDYISKPIDYDVLIQLVKAWVNKRV